MAQFEKRLEHLIHIYHKDMGGQKFKDEDEEDTKGLTPYETNKIKLAKKIQATRQKIKERDEALQNKRGGTRVVKMSNDIKKMIKILKSNYKELKEMHEKKKKGGFLKKKKMDEKEIRKEEEDLLNIFNHIKEVEALDKRRFQKKEEKTAESSSSDKKGDIEMGDIKFEDATDGKSGALQRLVLPDDPMASNLPEIDISHAMAKVKEMTKQVDQGLDRFGQELDKLKEMTIGISEGLDEGQQILDSIEKKVDSAQEQLDTLNTKVEDAIDKVGQSSKLVCLVILAIIILLFAGTGFFAVMQYL